MYVPVFVRFNETNNDFLTQGLCPFGIETDNNKIYWNGRQESHCPFHSNRKVRPFGRLKRTTILLLSISFNGKVRPFEYKTSLSVWIIETDNNNSWNGQQESHCPFHSLTNGQAVNNYYSQSCCSFEQQTDSCCNYKMFGNMMSAGIISNEYESGAVCPVTSVCTVDTYRLSDW